MQRLMATYGYVAVFLVMLAESACVPVPCEFRLPGKAACDSRSATGNVVATDVCPAAAHRWAGRAGRRAHHPVLG
jgi:membrane protein DedA with SNARE-associated domain